MCLSTFRYSIIVLIACFLLVAASLLLAQRHIPTTATGSGGESLYPIVTGSLPQPGNIKKSIKDINVSKLFIVRALNGRSEVRKKDASSFQ